MLCVSPRIHCSLSESLQPPLKLSLQSSRQRDLLRSSYVWPKTLMLKLNFDAVWGIFWFSVTWTDIKFSRLASYSKHTTCSTRSLCILKKSMWGHFVVCVFVCVRRRRGVSCQNWWFLLYFFCGVAWCVVLWALCAVARQCSWLIHPSSARSLSAARSSNSVFVWKPSIIFLSMTLWQKDIPVMTACVCFYWYVLMYFCFGWKKKNLVVILYLDIFTRLNPSGE